MCSEYEYASFIVECRDTCHYNAITFLDLIFFQPHAQAYYFFRGEEYTLLVHAFNHKTLDAQGDDKK